jgi:hypothetical protein
MNTCPRGVKVQLLGTGGVAMYGIFSKPDGFFTHWAPLPKVPKEKNMTTLEPPTDIAAYIDWILRGGRFDNSHRAPQPAQEWQEIECPCCGELARAFPPALAPEWVGLTDVEVGDALIELPILGNGYFLRIAKAIEAKLKEKNT